MRIHEVQLSDGAGPPLSLVLHPQITVVTGLAPSEQAELGDILAAVIYGRSDGLGGTVDVAGELLPVGAWAEMVGEDLDQFDVFVRPTDMPAPGAVGPSVPPLSERRALADERTDPGVLQAAERVEQAAADVVACQERLAQAAGAHAEARQRVAALDERRPTDPPADDDEAAGGYPEGEGLGAAPATGASAPLEGELVDDPLGRAAEAEAAAGANARDALERAHAEQLTSAREGANEAQATAERIAAAEEAAALAVDRARAEDERLRTEVRALQEPFEAARRDEELARAALAVAHEELLKAQVCADEARREHEAAREKAAQEIAIEVEHAGRAASPFDESAAEAPTLPPTEEPGGDVGPVGTAPFERSQLQDEPRDASPTADPSAGAGRRADAPQAAGSLAAAEAAMAEAETAADEASRVAAEVDALSAELARLQRDQAVDDPETVVAALDRRIDELEIDLARARAEESLFAGFTEGGGLGQASGKRSRAERRAERRAAAAGSDGPEAGADELAAAEDEARRLTARAAQLRARADAAREQGEGSRLRGGELVDRRETARSELEALRRQLHSPGPAHDIGTLAAALRRVEAIPDPEQVALCQQLLGDIDAALNDRSQISLSAAPRWLVEAARTALEEARVDLARAEEMTRPVRVDADDAAALEEAHSEILEAEERAERRIGGLMARRRLERAVAKEREVLMRLGFASYSAYLFRTLPTKQDSEASQHLVEAQRAMADAEAVWEELHRVGVEQAPAEMEEAEARLLARAAMLLGADAIGRADTADPVVTLRSVRQLAAEALRAVEQRASAVEDLVAALRQVGAPETGADDAVPVARGWLEERRAQDDEQQALAQQVAELERELEVVQREIDTAEAAPPADPDALAAHVAAAEEAERQADAARQRLESAAIAVGIAPAAAAVAADPAVLDTEEAGSRGGQEAASVSADDRWALQAVAEVDQARGEIARIEAELEELQQRRLDLTRGISAPDMATDPRSAAAALALADAEQRLVEARQIAEQAAAAASAAIDAIDDETNAETHDESDGWASPEGGGPGGSSGAQNSAGEGDGDGGLHQGAAEEAPMAVMADGRDRRGGDDAPAPEPAGGSHGGDGREGGAAIEAAQVRLEAAENDIERAREAVGAAAAALAAAEGLVTVHRQALDQAEAAAREASEALVRAEAESEKTARSAEHATQMAVQATRARTQAGADLQAVLVGHDAAQAEVEQWAEQARRRERRERALALARRRAEEQAAAEAAAAHMQAKREAARLAREAAAEALRSWQREQEAAAAELQESELAVQAAEAAFAEARAASDAALAARQEAERAATEQEVVSSRPRVVLSSPEPADGGEGEIYLLSRLTAARSVGRFGAIPVILLDPIRDLPAAVRQPVHDLFERIAPAVQVIYVTNELDVVGWARTLGSGRAGVLDFGTAPAAG